MGSKSSGRDRAHTWLSWMLTFRTIIMGEVISDPSTRGVADPPARGCNPFTVDDTPCLAFW